MKSSVKQFLLNPLKMEFVLILAVMTAVFSCSKSNDNSSGSNSTGNSCRTLNWNDTDGRQGYFTDTTINGKLTLASAYYKDNQSKGTEVFHYDQNGHLVNDVPDVTFTYTQDNLTKINVTGGNGAGSYNFDNTGHLTTGIIEFTGGSLTGTLTGTYTYDSNDDPVKVSGIGILSSDNGPVNIDIEVTGDFLTDKASMLPFVPLIAPASSYFSFIPFLSKHLLNKWDATFTESVNGQTVLSQHLTYQYSYTFDSNGNVATMVHTGNPNNIYTFTYSNCK